MILQRKIFLASMVCTVVALGGCIKDKNNTITTPALMAQFATVANAAVDNYYIKNDPNSVYKLPVGLSTFSTTDKNITFTVTSSTGAVAGTQYNLGSTSITIPAGKLIDSISVKGLFAGYPTGRKDTLTFAITGGDAVPFPSYSTFKLVAQKYCDVIGANLIGDYTKSTDVYGGAASTKPNYTANISNFTPITATTASVIIKNIGATSDNGWGPFGPTDPVTTPGLNATLNWTNPASFTVSIPLQNYFNDGSGNSTISATGTFSACDNTFSIVCSVKYAGTGSTYTHTSNLKR